MADLSAKTKQQYLNLKREPVNSSQIKAIGYSGEDSKMLTVEFHSGKPGHRIWGYHPVTIEGLHLLLRAESIGKYFNENIKTNPHVSQFNLSI